MQNAKIASSTGTPVAQEMKTPVHSFPGTG